MRLFPALALLLAAFPAQAACLNADGHSPIVMEIEAVETSGK